ncbi:MAG TPA: VWA domain-containing protein [Prosthecochloris aestuarii]|uniref:VWA domain-containing protein n=1 Tax=Prosthecochloris aestuarii TaxID=1102 RepID=A0A831WUZ1_PROAE|nr:VWA domain-containing protein [Prosthecochloris aestuarii]
MEQDMMIPVRSFLFEEPLWLVLLIALPLLRLLAARFFDFAKVRFPGAGQLRKEGFAMNPFLSVLPSILWWCGVFFIVISLARPSLSRMVAPQEETGIDIMLALDVSRSMLQEDFDGTSRLDAAKQVSLKFIDARKHDRIGLVLFRGKSFTRCPLTLDHDALGMLVQSASTDAVGSSGTAIGSAILVATNRLRASVSPERVLVLVTDGENNTGEVEPVTAARVAAGQGVRIYVIDVAVSGPDDAVEDVPAALNSYERTVSSEIARMTGGRRFDVSDHEGLKQTFLDIDQLEKSRFSSRMISRPFPLYPFALAAALVCFLIELGLSNTRLVRVV